MNRKSFLLKPFSSTELHPEFKMTGFMERSSGMLSVSCSVLGPVAALAIPAPANMPVRRMKLWEETCLELFLGPRNSDTYWEFNLSPAGHWNAFRFTSYRHGMQEEQAFRKLPFSFGILPGELRLSFELDLDRISRRDSPLEAAVTAVIRTAAGGVTFWAMTHPGTRPDFHRRDGFIIELEGEAAFS